MSFSISKACEPLSSKGYFFVISVVVAATSCRVVSLQRSGNAVDLSEMSFFLAFLFFFLSRCHQASGFPKRLRNVLGTSGREVTVSGGASEVSTEHDTEESSDGDRELRMYTDKINHCSKRGQSTTAEMWFERMLNDGVEPDVKVFSMLIKACAQKRDMTKARVWFDRMEERGVAPDVVTYIAMISSFTKCGDMESAEAWFTKMVHSGLKPNAASFGKIIFAYALRGELEKATTWFERLKTAGFKPNVLTFNSMITACIERDDPESVKTWISRMELAEVAPNMMTYSLLLRHFARQGETHLVTYWYDRMITDGFQLDTHLGRHLIRIFNARHDWESASLWMSRVSPRD